MSLTQTIPVPVRSVDPTDWLVYADNTEERGAVDKVAADAARRIAFVLGNWQKPKWHKENDPRLVLTLAHPHQPGGLRRQWQWVIPPATDLERDDTHHHYYNMLTNPTVLAGFDDWVRLKFFHFLLQLKNVRTLIGPLLFTDYVTRFYARSSGRSLRDICLSKPKCIRRACWIRGERLELSDHVSSFTGQRAQTAHAFFYNGPGAPVEFQLYLAEENTLTHGNKHWCARVFDPKEEEPMFCRPIRKIRPLARDWVLA